jgi:hypothetical protein
MRTPVLRRDGRTEGYPILWSKSLHRMVDPAVELSQKLHPIDLGEDFTLCGPVILPVSAIDVFCGTTTCAPARITRGPLSISWEPRLRWTQGISPIPGSDLAASLNFGGLAVATVALELLQGVSALGLRLNIPQMAVGNPSLGQADRTARAPSELAGHSAGNVSLDIRSVYLRRLNGWVQNFALPCGSWQPLRAHPSGETLQVRMPGAMPTSLRF